MKIAACILLELMFCLDKCPGGNCWFTRIEFGSFKLSLVSHLNDLFEADVESSLFQCEIVYI